MTTETEGSELDALAALVKGRSSAISLRSPLVDFPPLQVSVRREGGWSHYGTKIQECVLGDRICFQIHTYPNGLEAISVRNRLSIKRREKPKSMSYTVHSIISAVGFPDLNAGVRILVLGSRTLQLSPIGFEWYTRKTKQKHSNIKRDLNELSDANDVFSESGVVLGNLSEGEKSNLLVYFEVTEHGTSDFKERRHG